MSIGTCGQAKVPPSAADLRKKYLENIEKMVAAQEKYAVYTAEIRAVDGDGGLSLPAIALAPGRIAYDTAAAAAAADADENLRDLGSLWSVAWGPSPLSFLHRTAARALLAAAEAGAVRVPLLHMMCSCVLLPSPSFFFHFCLGVRAARRRCVTPSS